MMFDHPLKSVVNSPFLSIAHIGTAPPPTLQAAAETVRLMTAQVDGFQASNVDNGFVKGNFLPLQEERWGLDSVFATGSHCSFTGSTPTCRLKAKFRKNLMEW